MEEADPVAVDFDADELSAGEDAGVSIAIPGNVNTPLGSAASSLSSSKRPASELTIGFEGEVFVFPAVTRDKVILASQISHLCFSLLGF